MSAVASAAQEYLHTMSPTAARVAQDSEGHNRQQPESLLWFFRGPGGQKVVRDDATGHSFRDEHSGPFSYRSNSQIDLIAEMEPPPPAIANLADNTHMNRDLVLSHCRVLSELKNALKTDHTKDSGRIQSRVSKYEPEFVVQEPPKPPSDDSGFISKLLGNKKYKSGYSEEKEQLVSSEKRCQIVASSDNYFKTNFGGLNHNVKENHGIVTFLHLKSDYIDEQIIFYHIVSQVPKNLKLSWAATACKRASQLRPILNFYHATILR